MVKTFHISERKYPLAEKMGFSIDGSFFFETGNVCTIWDYESEIIVAAYEDEKSTYDLSWLSGRQYILFRKRDQPRLGLHRYEAAVTWNEILTYKSIKEKAKNEISSYMIKRMDEAGLRYGNTFVKGIDERLICTVVGGERYFQL